MKNLKNWHKFVEKLNIDEVLDLYNHLMRILKIHEDYYYKDDKISSDSNFKEEINSTFHKMVLGKKPFTEEIYNKVLDYEKKHYVEDKIAPDGNFGNSMWDVCDVIVEDPDTLNINNYIQNFSKEDIYVQMENPYMDTESIISGLDELHTN